MTKKAPVRAVLGGIEDPLFGKLLDFHFQRLGWEIGRGKTGKEILPLVAGSGTRLVILDGRLAGAAELCERLKTNPRTWRVPVFLVFSGGEAGRLEEGFFVCGDQHFREPFEIVDFLRLAEREAARAQREGDGGALEVRLQLLSRREDLERTQRVLAGLMADAGLVESRLWPVEMAMREALLNALQHGNRGDAAKRIRVRFRADQRQVAVTVQDEGPGFDYNRFLTLGKGDDALSAVRRRHRQGGVGGLGILLMTKSVDDVQYSPDGSAVTLVKYRT